MLRQSQEFGLTSQLSTVIKYLLLLNLLIIYMNNYSIFLINVSYRELQENSITQIRKDDLSNLFQLKVL